MRNLFIGSQLEGKQLHIRSYEVGVLLIPTEQYPKVGLGIEMYLTRYDRQTHSS